MENNLPEKTTSTVNDIRTIVNPSDLDQDKDLWKCSACNILIYSESHYKCCPYSQIYPSDRTELISGKPPEIPESDWQIYTHNESGSLYYYNKLTKITQWELPDDYLNECKIKYKYRFTLARKYIEQNPRPRVFFHVNFAGKAGGRIVIELFGDVCPLAAFNFYSLCTGEFGKGLYGYPLHFKGCSFYKYDKDKGLFCGGFTNNPSHTSDNIYADSFEKENLGVEHSEENIIYMSHDDDNGSGSTFFISNKSSDSDLYKNYVAVGYIVSGNVVAQKIIDTTDSDGIPRTDSVIADCGEVVDPNAAKNIVQIVEKKSQTCYDYINGKCVKGDLCIYQHPASVHPNMPYVDPTVAYYYYQQYAQQQFSTLLTQIDKGNGIKWMKVIDPTSQTPYYYNTETLQTTWDVPEGYVEYEPDNNPTSTSEIPELTMPEQTERSIDANKEMVKHQTSYAQPVYTCKGTFNTKTGRWEGPEPDYLTRNTNTMDSAGKQMSYYFDINQLNGPTRKKKSPQLPKGYDNWQEYKEELKVKKRIRQVREILEDPYEGKENPGAKNKKKK